jgi:hypothetical protein
MYYWDDQIKENEISGACSTNGEIINAYIFVGEPEGKRIRDTCQVVVG